MFKRPFSIDTVPIDSLLWKHTFNNKKPLIGVFFEHDKISQSTIDSSRIYEGRYLISPSGVGGVSWDHLNLHRSVSGRRKYQTSSGLLLSALQCSDDRVVIGLQILQYWYHYTLHTAEPISVHTLDIYWASQVAQCSSKMSTTGTRYI